MNKNTHVLLYAGQFGLVMLLSWQVSAGEQLPGCEPGPLIFQDQFEPPQPVPPPTDIVRVSSSDPNASDDGSCGTLDAGYPCLSIAQGLSRAQALSFNRVHVANGIYFEAVSLVPCVHLLGGFDPATWEHNPQTTNTIINGSKPLGPHRVTVDAISLNGGSRFEGFVVRGAINSLPGGNSYAIYVRETGYPLIIRHNNVQTGRAGPGSPGIPGIDGSEGQDGIGRNSPGIATSDYDALIASGSGSCNVSNNRQYANGGSLLCGTSSVDGGRGGGNQCPPSNSLTQLSASDGAIGQFSNGGLAGVGGEDGRLESNGTICILPPSFINGLQGGPGGHGSDGVAGASCSMPLGYVAGGHWSNGFSSGGSSGQHGSGGGGGGAGGGAFCLSCSENKDRLGGHGGGGGSGACGGGGGGAATGGGSAFGIFVSNGAAPVISSNVIERGEGGNGGSGGLGGVGRTGGMGGDGGMALFCTGQGGQGGQGGNGGNGAGGSGGCGGSSFGIFSWGMPAPDYCSPGNGNVFFGGLAGNGGSGGLSIGSNGPDGAPGLVVSCHHM